MENFSTEYAKLNNAQKRAVNKIDGPVLVIAGPGTGKTQLLSMRVANILEKTDTLPQNILCLTFTDSAAANLRKRLSSLIGKLAYDVNINTYHAFGSELIRRYPEYFVDSPDMRPAADLSIDQTLRQILEGLPYSNPLKFSTSYIKDVSSLISDFKRALLTPTNVRSIAKANLKFITEMSKTVRISLMGMQRINKSTVELFRKLSEETTDKYDDGAELPNDIRPLHEQWQARLEIALEYFDETGKTTEVTAWKNDWLVKNNRGEFIVAGELSTQKLLAAANVYEDYLRNLADQNLFDYDDMIIKAINGLEANDDLRFTLQEQYQYLLLDEFQDTNIAQLKLVNLLLDSPVNEGRPNVMAVGDDDQAIYAFQGADYSHMLEFARSYRDVLVVTLTENYRSHHDILDLAHNIAEQIGGRLHHNFEGVTKTLVASNKKLPDSAIVERREFKSDLAEYAWVSKQIQNLIAQGMPASEIAILAPGHRYLEPLIPYLNKASVAVHYEKRENVLDDPLIHILTQMAHLISALDIGDHLTASSLWPEILSYDAWNLPTSLIWQLSWQANDNHADWTNILLENPLTNKIALFFIRLSLVSGTETLEIILDYLIGVQPLKLGENEQDDYYSSPFYEYYFAADKLSDKSLKFWDLLNNLTVLRQHLREYKSAEPEPLKLADLLEFIDAYRSANIKILNTNPHHESTEAVQLMTAFKAKGQEFEAVFVLATNDEVWGDKARTQHSRLPLPTNLEFIRYGGANDDERLRLFFVALTRAKTQLYLTNYTNNYAGKPQSRLRYLNEYENEDGKAISQYLPLSEQHILGDNHEAPTIEDYASYWEDRHIKDIGQADLKSLLLPRLEKFLLSPTHVNSFIDTIYGGPEKFFVNTLLRFPKAPTATGQYGNAIHETLEWVHNYNRRHSELPTEKQIQNQFTTRLESKKLSTKDTEQLLDRGLTALKVYFTQKSSEFMATNEHEYNFKNEAVFVGDAHLSGKIDKLIVNKVDKTISVVDFKTGTSYSRWSNLPKLYKYKQQLYIYKLLVENSHSFAGYKVIDAYLQFVEPDDEGNVIDLHLKFDDAELDKIKHLIQKVWQHVQNLNFPDASGYSADYKGMRALEDDIINGTVQTK